MSTPKAVVLPPWDGYERAPWCSDSRDEVGLFKCIKCGHLYPWVMRNVVHRAGFMWCARCDARWPAHPRRTRRGK